MAAATAICSLSIRRRLAAYRPPPLINCPDFNAAEGDVIDLSMIDANTIAAGD